MQEDAEAEVFERGDSIGVQAERGFATRMRELREQLGLSQAELAKRLRVHGLKLDSTAITRMEQHASPKGGARVIRFGEAVAIADILGSSLQDMTRAQPTLSEQLQRAQQDYVTATAAAQTAALARQQAAERVASLEALIDERRAEGETIRMLEGARDTMQSLMDKLGPDEPPTPSTQKQD